MKLHIRDEEYTTYHLRCPQCGYVWGVEAKEKPPYERCPMCGAKVEIE